MPCCSRQLRSGNTQPSTASKTFMPSSSAVLGPAMPSRDTDMPTTTLVISDSSSVRAPAAPVHRWVGAIQRVLYIGAGLFSGQAQRAPCEVPALGKAGRPARRLAVARGRAGDIAGHLQQVRAG